MPFASGRGSVTGPDPQTPAATRAGSRSQRHYEGRGRASGWRGMPSSGIGSHAAA